MEPHHLPQVEEVDNDCLYIKENMFVEERKKPSSSNTGTNTEIFINAEGSESRFLWNKDEIKVDEESYLRVLGQKVNAANSDLIGGKAPSHYWNKETLRVDGDKYLRVSGEKIKALNSDLFAGKELSFFATSKALQQHSNDTGIHTSVEEKRNWERAWSWIHGNTVEDKVKKAMNSDHLGGLLPSQFIRRDKHQEVQGALYSPGYSSGFAGSGAVIDFPNGMIELDKLTVRKEATFFDLVIQQMKYIGGSQVVSAGAIKVNHVQETGDTWRCYFEPLQGAVSNPLVTNDIVRCQRFGTTSKYYSAIVVDSGLDYVDLSKETYDGTLLPEVGDHLVQFGNTEISDRQSLIVISSMGSSSPSIDLLSGVDSFSLDNKLVQRIGNLDGVTDPAMGRLSGYGMYAENVYLKGRFVLDSGDEIGTVLSSKANSSSVTNMVRGLNNRIAAETSRTNQQVDENKRQIATQEQNLTNLKIGGRNFALDSDSEKSIRGYRGTFYRFSQPLNQNEQYTFSFKLKSKSNDRVDVYFTDRYGGNPRQTVKAYLSLNDQPITITTDQAWNGICIYQETDQADALCVIEWIKVEKGNKATDWTPAPEDTDLKIQQVRETLESSITQTSEAISLKVSKTYVDDKVSNIQNVGINLFRESLYENWNHVYGFAAQTVYLDAGQEYTFSFEGKINQEAINNKKELRGFLYYPDWSWNHSIAIKSLDESKVSHTFTPPKSGNISLTFYMFPSGGTYKGSVYLKRFKLEKGNKATDWSPAITDHVFKKSIISEINQSAEAIKISASKIQIDGTTTFAPGFKFGVARLDNTIIEGGYIKTSLINAKQITALGNITAGSFNLGNGKFVVTQDGQLTAQGANIIGNLKTGTGSTRLEFDSQWNLLKFYKNDRTILSLGANRNGLSFYLTGDHGGMRIDAAKSGHALSIYGSVLINGGTAYLPEVKLRDGITITRRSRSVYVGDCEAPDFRKWISISGMGVTSTSYIVLGSFYIKDGTAWQDNDVIWSIQGKTTTGFYLSMREVASTAQHLYFEFIIIDTVI
ncbi:hypothetical protein K5X82_07415 [Halosquirtibacter xylanolyticus]|uniref:hypothetical protein n=1 Tax=Halosquirtibacter xylanolyticus TaxID=3374599 RepID=UPI00374898DA|nr:hypothetical protein K5X82_07415 [Prolixibacteraceae bacterium]